MSLENKFNSSTDFIGVVSLGGVLASGLLLLTPIQGVGYIGIGSGLGAFTASVITRKKHLDIVNQHINVLTTQHRTELSAKDSENVVQSATINSLRVNVNNLSSSIKTLELEKEAHVLELSKINNNVEALTNQNQSFREHLKRVTNELDSQIAVAKLAVEEAISEWDKKLTLLVDTKKAKKEQYPKLTERLNELLNEAKELLADYTVKLNEIPKSWESLADLLSLYYCVNDDLTNIKTKAIQAITTLTNQQTQVELEEVSEILEEWQTANLVPKDRLDHIIKNYEAALNEFRLEFTSRFEATKQFAAILEAQNQDDDKFVQGIIGKIKELEAKIYHLSKPITYPGATRTDMQVANIIINYFHQLGIILDRAGSDYRGYEANLEFIADRTGRLILASELNEHSERLQALTHVLNKPEFKLDAESGLITLLIRWGQKPAVNNADQAKRLLSPLADVVKKIIDGLSHKPTTRIMGATGEGKGVMIRYLLNIILTTNNWYCRIHDPQHGSDEDYWGIPKVSKSGNELKEALKNIESQLTRRETTKTWSITTLDVLDEIDTHLEKKEKKEAFINLISRIRHCGMKLVLIGQNPKVGRAGFEWSDMQQMNCIYMGASALDAIEANPQLKLKKEKLSKDYLILSEYYESVNEGLGDNEKYLFGLVVIPGKTPLWFELPRPDSVKIDCNPLLLANSFSIPDSLDGLIASQNNANNSGNSAIINSNSMPSANAVTLVQKGMPAIADTSDYVGFSGTDGTGGNSGTASCKKHPTAELTIHKDGRYYCTSCKRRLSKSDVQYS
jgi:hypothetical protein